MLIEGNKANGLYGLHRQAGLSLVELMVSILLGIILSAGIVAVYLESKRNYDAEESQARIQENGRFALSLLKRELSLAGFYGGHFVADDTPAVSVGTDCVSGSNWALDASPSIEVIDDFDAGTPNYTTKSGNTLSNCSLDNIQDGTDVIVVKRSAGEPTYYNSDLQTGAAFDPNEWYLRVEGFGEKKEWIQSASVALDPNTTEYWEVYTKVFFVRDFSSTAGDGVPSLCVRELTSTGMTQTRCLVEGVEDMQIEFGVDTDGDGTPNIYTPDPNDIEVAITARLYLLVRSIGELVSSENANTKTYQLGLSSGTTVMDDGYLRQLFSTTVMVRNAVLPVTN